MKEQLTIKILIFVMGKWQGHLSASIVLFFLQTSLFLILNGNGINYTRGNTRHSATIHRNYEWEFIWTAIMGIVCRNKSALFMCVCVMTMTNIFPHAFTHIISFHSSFFCLSTTFLSHSSLFFHYLCKKLSWILHITSSCSNLWMLFPFGLHFHHHMCFCYVNKIN